MSGITNLKIIGLDSNVFIYHFEANPEFIKRTELILSKLLKNKLKAVTSVISITEALSYPSPQPILDAITEGFNTIPNLTIYEINKEIAIEAARIRREYKMRMPDALQLATALVSKAQVFITNDDHLKKIKEIKIMSLTDI